MRGELTTFPDAPGAAAVGNGLTDQQEAFCQAFVFYANAALAARQAGYAAASARQSGHRLLSKPHVAARVAGIRQHMAREGCRNTGILLGKLENVYNRALEDRAYHAASRTVEIQARLAGLMPSVHERLRVISPEPGESAETREN